MTGVLPGLGAGRNIQLGQWDTSPELARALVRWARLDAEGVVDLSCGIGNILAAARELRPAHNADDFAPVLWGLEIDEDRAEVCRSREIPVLTGDVMDEAVGEHVRMVIGSGPSRDFGCVALGNPPFEDGAALTHPLRWLTLGASRACWIAPLTTLAGAARLALWHGLELRRVDVCVPRPKFGASGGATEIAFFEAYPLAEGLPPSGPAALGWVEWRVLGAPVAT